MEFYGGKKIKLSPLEKNLRYSTDEELFILNIASTLNVKLAILKEYSFRYYKIFDDLCDNDLLLKCSSEQQLERSLALKIASFKNII